MRIVRYQIKDEAPKFGWLLDDKVGEIEGDIFGAYQRKEAITPLAEVKLLAPSTPSKIICVGRNYVEHAKELGNEVPNIPLIFLKPPSSVINPGETIILPPQSKQIEHEAELVVVIGKRGHHITAEQAKEHIFGYTVGNDVTARDLQKTDDQWTRAKGFDTFCPFGPWIETDADPADLELTTRLNGEIKQHSRTSLLIHDVQALVMFVSQVMTMLPGDVLLTGTPAGVGPMAKGDEVSVTIEGIGTLSNPVTDRE